MTSDVVDKNAFILVSGGIDSTMCIYHYQKIGYKVKGLFVDYGQPAAFNEGEAIKKISSYFDIEIQTIKSDIKPIIDHGIIQGRNYLLLSIALACFPFQRGIISLGIHSGTKYADCSAGFISSNQKIIDLYSYGNVAIDCPFIQLNKRDIYNYFIKTKIPIALTYSCELGGNMPCGKCHSCKDIKVLQDESKN